ncbi:MAG: matrixin family metalloprotease [Deltaproteobacteria bacterium]|nr:matrixin family metalloprotease [Deltaproteobacteria bacterium]
MEASAVRRAALQCILFPLLTSAALPSAHAYCFTSSCGQEQPICEPAENEPCGVALRWKRECVGYAIQQNGTASLSLTDIQVSVRSAFDAWSLAGCETGDYPGIDVIDMGLVSCNKAEFNESAGNVNVVTFLDDSWPYPDNGEALALTTVTYANKSGEILDADIEVNTAMFKLTVAETTKDYDLTGVLTHEAGHFYGMAHSLDQESTMHGDALPGSTDLRSLTLDDTSGICTLYPSKTINYEACNPLPIHGFASECAAEQWKESCSVAPSAAGHAPPTWWRSWAVAAGLGAAIWARRAQRRKRIPKPVINPDRLRPTSRSNAMSLDGR